MIANTPDIWIEQLPRFSGHINKYDRGHAVILAAPELMGATRLAAAGCSRIGAGLVTVLTNTLTTAYRTTLPADIMVQSCDISDLNRVSVMMGGSGGLTDQHYHWLIENKVKVKRVLDADALRANLPISKLDEDTVMTPHDGEFDRLFGHQCGSREEQLQAATQKAGCIIIRKGADTLIGHPDGRFVRHYRPNPYLAKAGTGDVLAGFLTGLMAQGMPPFEAACAATWIHSKAGQRLGPGLISSDLETQLPEILRELLEPKR